MKLNFIGRGSAFNITEGNTSAFYKNESNKFFLIDCGETVFSSILHKKLLNDVNDIYVAITHTHADHFGSFGSLALYAFYVKKIKLNVILSNDEKYNKFLKDMIKNVGVNEDYINYLKIEKFIIDFQEFKGLKFLRTPHVKELATYGLEIETKQGIIYYSSDTNSTKYLKYYINNNNTYKIYMDICKAHYRKNAHLSYINAIKVIPREKAKKVFAMHIDCLELIPILKRYGIGVVEKV